MVKTRPVWRVDLAVVSDRVQALMRERIDSFHAEFQRCFAKAVDESVKVTKASCSPQLPANSRPLWCWQAMTEASLKPLLECIAREESAIATRCLQRAVAIQAQDERAA